MIRVNKTLAFRSLFLLSNGQAGQLHRLLHFCFFSEHATSMWTTLTSKDGTQSWSYYRVRDDIQASRSLSIAALTKEKQTTSCKRTRVSVCDLALCALAFCFWELDTANRTAPIRTPFREPPLTKNQGV